MIDWAARARAQLAQQPHGGTNKTDETPLLAVSSVVPGGHAPNRERLSSVSSVAHPQVAVAGMAAAGNADAVAANERIACAPALDGHHGNPYLALEQVVECHAWGWDDAEIDLFVSRATRFSLLGRNDGEHLAERLTLRDRQADDRRMCLECRELDSTGRCAAARRGAIQGADRGLVPVQNILMRCAAFTGILNIQSNHKRQ